MAGLDYSSIADNLTREIMVLAIEMPEAFDAIAQLKDQAVCVKAKLDEIKEEYIPEEEEEDGDDVFESFTADSGSQFASDDADCDLDL